MVFRILWRNILIGVAALAVLSGGAWFYWTQIRVVPEELLGEALAKTLQLSQYKYLAQAQLTTDGKEKSLLSNVTGERAGANFHLRGTMMRQDVEIYQVGDNTYFLDTTSKKWLSMPGNGIFDQQFFTAELDPLSNFSLTSLADLQYLGKEKLEGDKTYVFACRPKVENEFLEVYWQDFYYQIWVDAGSRYVAKATIEANNKIDPEDKIVFNVRLWDWNRENVIKVPEGAQE